MSPGALAKITTVVVVTLSQANVPVIAPEIQGTVLTSHEISLENRYPVKSVSDIFKDNILLNLAYLRGIITSTKDINWDEVSMPFHYTFRLEPNQTFAFHDDISNEYLGKVTKTTNAHFNSYEGFKTDGYLFGDGVCHLASLMYWVAKDSNIDAKAPTRHDFMAIPEIDRQYGVSIYSNPFSKGSNTQQNLYITNNRSKPIEFMFDYSDKKLRLSLLEVN